jgi:hypothetical protein
MMRVSDILTRRIVDVRALPWVMNNDQKNIKIIKLSDGSKEVQGFETISFDSVEGLSDDVKRIYEKAFFNDLRINPTFKKEIIDYLLDKTGHKEEPVQGLKVYKKEIPQQPMISLKDASNYDLKKLHHIIVKHNEIKSDELNDLLEKNSEHTVILDLSLDTGNFVNTQGEFSLSPNDLSDKIKYLLIIGNENVSSIGNFFLAGYVKIISLGLRSLKNLEVIKEGFIFACRDLRSVDLSGIENVSSILDQGSFLANCPSLESVDLTPLKNVTSIGDGFLHGCKNLKQLFVKDEADKARWIKLLDSNDSNKHLQKLLTIKDTSQNSEENNQENTNSDNTQEKYVINYSTDMEGVD